MLIFMRINKKQVSTDVYKQETG